MTVSELYSIYLKHPAVSTDSRNCVPESIFFALKGERFDGHAFVDNALQAGCAYAIVDVVAKAIDKRVIVVENVLHTLQQLARIHRKALGVRVIGITGTNGKTTTKELIAAVLSQKYKVLSTLGNLNNHIGVPLTLLRLTDKHEMAVIEMGANHPGEIAELAAIACPDYGLITNVGYAHLEGFGSLEGVIKAKGELYDYLRKTNGTVFIHRDNEHLTSVSHDLQKIMYGAANSTGISGGQVSDNRNYKKQTDVNDDSVFPLSGGLRGAVRSLNPYLSFSWQYRPDEVYEVSTKLVGGYNLWNVLAAIAIGVHFNVPCEKINEAIAGYQPANNRSQLQKTNFNELIMDAYNANPSSMRAALDNFSNMTSGRKAVILGDMRELGAKSLELHAAILKQIESCDYEKVLLCGEHFSAAGQQYLCFPTIEKLCEYLETRPLRGYHILIKGSRAIGLEKTIEFL